MAQGISNGMQRFSFQEHKFRFCRRHKSSESPVVTPLITYLKWVHFQNLITSVLFSKSREYVHITNNVSIEDNRLKVFSRKINYLTGLKSRYPHLSQVFLLCQDTKAQSSLEQFLQNGHPVTGSHCLKNRQIKALSERSGSECSDHFKKKSVGKEQVPFWARALSHQTRLTTSNRTAMLQLLSFCHTLYVYSIVDISEYG